MPYSKVAVQAVIREVQAGGNFPATVLRLPAVYGPGDALALERLFVKRFLDGWSATASTVLAPATRR